MISFFFIFDINPFCTSQACLFSLTDEVPLSVGDVVRDVSLQHLQVQRPAPVRPGAKLQLAPLDIEGEPAHVDVAGALEDPC